MNRYCYAWLGTVYIMNIFQLYINCPEMFSVSSFSFSNFALYHIGEQKKTTIKRKRGASKFLNKENKSKLDQLEISR